MILGEILLASVADKAIICRSGDAHGLREREEAHSRERSNVVTC